MFTNIPLDLARKCQPRESIERSTLIPKKEFLNALDFVLNSAYFTFNGQQFFKQKFGTPMGSPLSPIIANLVMENLEVNALKKTSISIPFYFRYVDDIVMTVFSEIHKTHKF